MSESTPRPVRRIGGARYVRGEMKYTDDAVPPNALQLVFVRSTQAHARIVSIDTSGAESVPGVRRVLTGTQTADLIGEMDSAVPAALTATPRPLSFPCLPIDYVRYWGEPVALVVADTEDVARYAAEQVEVIYDTLTPLLTTAEAVAPDARVQHPQLESNVVMSGAVSDGDAEEAIAAASHVRTGRVHMGRSSALPLEPRACIADWNRDEGRLLLRVSSQLPHAFRADLSAMLGLPESDIHVLTPPLGGGFGFKFPGLPEEPLTALMAKVLRRPVRWAETRAESMLVGAREYDVDYTVAFDNNGRVQGLSVDFDANVGALAATPAALMSIVAAHAFPGGYDVSNFTVRWRAVTTNKGPWNGARGFGKEMSAVVLEAVMDDIAGELGLEPTAVRLANFLQSAQFPHRTPTMTVDSGDYKSALELVLKLADYDELKSEAQSQPGARVRKGVGVGFELTPEGQDPAAWIRAHETSTVRIDTSGHVTVLTGVTSPGTGSETGIAQLVAEQLGLSVDRIRVVQGDTDRTPYGSGSFSSRAVIAGGTAAWLAAGEMRQHLIGVAAVLLGAEPEQIVVADGWFSVRDEPERTVPIAALMKTWRTVGNALPGLPQDEMEVTRTYGPENIQALPDGEGRVQLYPTYAYSVHVAGVEVDIETGVVCLTSLAAVHDCGVVINEDLVTAQLHGAVAMGVGNALTEEERYDAEGRPLASSFKTYMFPRNKDIPRIRTGSLVSPSPYTILGTKGAGESGVGGAAAAIASAVKDALGIPQAPTSLPLTPESVLDLVDAAKNEAKKVAAP